MWPERGAGGIVLVVDDTPDTLRLLIDSLEAAGLTALVARDGASALALLDRIRPDAILLDAVMPGMDGFELCRRIKARSDLSAAPVLFMTGLSGPEHTLEGLRAGGVDYLVKPINPDEMIARVSIHVANARMVADAQSALDAAGASVVAFEKSGAVAWTSPRAAAVMAESVGELDALSPTQREQLKAWLAAVAEAPVADAAELRIAPDEARALLLSAIGRTGGGDILVRATRDTAVAPEETLRAAFPLSAREAEVLAWIAKGKSNRDIATILGLSPRTVTKHVEQVLSKLDVENRTAAAVTAIRALDRLS